MQRLSHMCDNRIGDNGSLGNGPADDDYDHEDEIKRSDSQISALQHY